MRKIHWTRARLAVVAATAVGGLAVGGAALASTVLAAPGAPAAAPITVPGTARPTAMPMASYHFAIVDNANDQTFNQLLGINRGGEIAGYFGSGAAGHPNQGYKLFAPYGQGNFAAENFPGSVQTQVTGLNDMGDTVGFWSSMNTGTMVNDNFGFYKLKGHKGHTVVFPTGDNASPQVDQLLGVNDHDVAVGFYTNGQGSNRGYTYNIRTRQFARVLAPGYPVGTAGPSLTAAAINNHGDVAGFYTAAKGVTDAFLQYEHGAFVTLRAPGASATQALGVNDHDEVVGVYTVGTGSNAAMHGFSWTPSGGFVSVDAPQGMTATTINGVNDAGELVGFFADATGNTDGFLATAQHH